MRGILSSTRCDEIKQEVLYMYEETETHTWPIDCFAIAKALNYIVVPYSYCSAQDMIAIDEDGFSRVVYNPWTGLYNYVIYYNDAQTNEGRLRWTIFHEIGHIYLGHHDNPDDSLSEIEEAEADFFAKYAIAPPPLINAADCKDMWDVQGIFRTSAQAAEYIYDYYRKWLQYGSQGFLPFEVKLLKQFNVECGYLGG